MNKKDSCILCLTHIDTGKYVQNGNFCQPCISSCNALSYAWPNESPNMNLNEDIEDYKFRLSEWQDRKDGYDLKQIK